MHSRVIFNNIKQADVFQNENEQACQIITELSNLPNFENTELNSAEWKLLRDYAVALLDQM